MLQHFDVIVIGAGHAGCEAASVAARLHRKTAMVTFRRDFIARLSCNPAIGGQAKGHLVRELDALGGIMARVTDTACIQFRRLNTRKGLAVQSSRAQVDIDIYPQKMRQRLESTPNLTILEGEVAELSVKEGRVIGIVLADGTQILAASVIATTGTFLGGVMFRGLDSTIGGRVDDGAAHRLSTSFGGLGLKLGRLKTGTPPRLDRNSIDWEQVPVQPDTVPEGRFSFSPPLSRLPQIECHLAYTNSSTHEIIRSGLDRSPMFTGVIQGMGPRYCPSIEDKVVRFADRERHLIFLEPEGLNTNRIYPNGLSTSLPVDIQERMIRSIAGLENAIILQPGYAVEYDHIDPLDLGMDLQHREMPGLYFAGQVNGTSGYEEAAVQGFIAGVSAAMGEPFILRRDEAYIGVLMDDLVSRGIGGEPYRMFTSRAEHRLLLREDNADRRLMTRGRELGLIDDPTWALFEAKQEAIHHGRQWLQDRVLVPDPATIARLEANGLESIRRPTTAEELLRRPEVEWPMVAKLCEFPMISDAAAEQIAIDVKYEGFVSRAETTARSVALLDGRALDPNLDWNLLPSLTTEVRQRLIRTRPTTLGQVRRIPGITPVAVNLIAAWLIREDRELNRESGLPS